MAAETILFDLDGTLWDSFAWYSELLSRCTRVEASITINNLKSGQNVIRIASELGVSKSRLVSACRSADGGPALYRSVTEVLRVLRDSDIKMGIVTNLSRPLGEPILEKSGIASFFPVQQYAAGKPSPKGILAALKELETAPAESVFYVGDTVTDSIAATRAGISFAFASYGCLSDPFEYDGICLTEFSDILEI